MGEIKTLERRASRQILPAATALSAGGVELIILVGFIIVFIYSFIISRPLFLFLGGAAFLGSARFLFLLVGVPALRGNYCRCCAKSNLSL